MQSPREGSPRRSKARRMVALAGIALGLALPTVGCQVEYAGMTLPSGKYMNDDVQYFAPGPDFPWANTQAATQRARMQAQGLDVNGPPIMGGAQGGFINGLPAPSQSSGSNAFGAPPGFIPNNVNPAPAPGGDNPAVPPPGAAGDNGGGANSMPR